MKSQLLLPSIIYKNYNSAKLALKGKMSKNGETSDKKPSIGGTGNLSLMEKR
ncbi:hypothetical protein [Aquiflexum sp.]|uniref:hypothetical protein n=1 Tax=Aquiflexum sp. TaxID=1872584 RepID=UPI0035946AAA